MAEEQLFHILRLIYSKEQMKAFLESGLIRINGTNHHWELFSISNSAWFDTGVIAQGTNGEHSITYDPMSLTASQKTQARDNIDAVAEDPDSNIVFSIGYDAGGLYVITD